MGSPVRLTGGDTVRDGVVVRLIPTNLGRDAEVQLNDGGGTVRVFEYALTPRRRKRSIVVALLGLVFAGVSAIAASVTAFDSHTHHASSPYPAAPISIKAGGGVAPKVSLQPIGGYAPANRPTFTWAQPASYVVFNSITDDKYYGDERPFFDGFEYGSGQRAQDVIQVHDREVLVLRVFYINDAASNLNLSARNTRVRILLPLAPRRRVAAAAEIYASNANPNYVSDTVTFVARQYFSVTYMPGTARLWTNGLHGKKLSDALMSRGVEIGYNKLDGIIPSDLARGSGWVTIRVRIYMAH